MQQRAIAEQVKRQGRIGNLPQQGWELGIEETHQAQAQTFATHPQRLENSRTRRQPCQCGAHATAPRNFLESALAGHKARQRGRCQLAFVSALAGFAHP